ncbi:het-domain-containing protein [Fusarium coicis]|nr:het-domain-containing protein [Fusarium coicis]
MTDNNVIYTERLDKGEIRVMKLYRGSESDVFKCDLRKIRLAASPAGQTPSYEALSYIWGSKKDPRHIYISGSRFAVTQNLFEALTYLRHSESDRTLWIDAICINQLDDDERTAQIHQMHQVYGNAKEAVAWIGKANSDTHEIFDSIASKGDVLERILAGPNWGGGVYLSAWVMKGELKEKKYHQKNWLIGHIGFVLGLFRK